MELEEMSRRYEKLYAGVIYDSIIFDLKHDKKFVVDLNINNKTHKGTLEIYQVNWLKSLDLNVL